MPRLRRSNCAGAGISRRRRGRGFSYSSPDGSPVTDPETLARIRALAIPPAWRDVWICPWPNGHIQAVGTDAAGRRQYRYHEQWRVERDREKFDRELEFAAALPKFRRVVGRDLRRGGLGRERVLAAIARLLDVGFFRVGVQEYAEEHETFGIASLRRQHVSIHEGLMTFEYPAKGSIERKVEVRDAQACEVVTALRRRRSGGANLFAYQRNRRWIEVRADDVNDYIKAAAGDQFTAKDFRTWSATVVAAAALADHEPVPDSPTRRHRAVVEAIGTVAEHLGNTPAVSRSAYVDPRIVERFDRGETVNGHPPAKADHGLRDLERRRDRGRGPSRALEEAVVVLLNDATPERRPAGDPPQASGRAAQASDS